jgi:hypothetical protein
MSLPENWWEKSWFDIGVHAGKTDGWMNVEETLHEDLERDPSITDSTELVWRDIDEWESTDHFQLTYGQKMMDGSGEEAIDKYLENKAEFWEGYLTGRGEIGIDIYKKAKDLISKKGSVKSKGKVKKKSPPGSVRGLRS